MSLGEDIYDTLVATARPSNTPPGSTLAVEDEDGRAAWEDVIGPLIEAGASASSHYRPAVLDKDLTAPPGSPMAGVRYIVATPGSGAWAGHDGQIAYWTGSAWAFEMTVEGWAVWVADEDAIYAYDGSTWAAVTGAVAPHTHPQSDVTDLVADLAALAGDISTVSTNLANHLADGTDAHDASAISYTGSGNWADATAITGSDVEAALDEVVSDLALSDVTSGQPDGAGRIGASTRTGAPNGLAQGSVGSQIGQLLGHLNAHINETGDAHDASAISYNGSSNNWADGTGVTGANVEAGLDEVVSDLGGSGGAAKIGVAAESSVGAPYSLSADDLQATLATLLMNISRLERPIQWSHQPRGNSTSFDSSGTAALTVTDPGAGPLAQPDPGVGYFMALLTSGSINSVASAVGATRIRRDFAVASRKERWLRFGWRVRTDSIITSSRIWVGVFSAAPSGGDDPAVHGIGFRYSTNAADANWQCWTNDGSGVGTTQDSGEVVAGSVAYDFEFFYDGTTVFFYINGVPVHSTSSQLPGSTTYMAEGAYLTALAGSAARTFYLGRCAISHG